MLTQVVDHKKTLWKKISIETGACNPLGGGMGGMGGWLGLLPVDDMAARRNGNPLVGEHRYNTMWAFLQIEDLGVVAPPGGRWLDTCESMHGVQKKAP